MAEIDVLKAQIVRQDLSTPWGFVLQGGVDQGTPLKIQTLLPGSPAARIGLKSGDEVTEVGDIQTEGLTLQQVQDLIDKHGDTLILTVERRARGSVPANPVMNATETEPVKDYQPYDMTGAQQQHPAPVSNPQSTVTVSSDTNQSANSVAETKPAAETRATADSGSTAESAPPANSVPAEKDAKAEESQLATVGETKTAAEPAQAAESAPAVEPVVADTTQSATEAPAPAEPEPAQQPVPAEQPAPAPQPAPPQPNAAPQAPPQEPATRQPERRRFRTRPTDATIVQPPAGPISQIVQGTGQISFTPSQFKPAVPAAPGGLYHPSPGQPSPHTAGPVFTAEPGRRPPEQEPVRSYQPYDMSGPRYYQPVETQPQIYKFETVRARPFQEKPRPFYRPQAQSPPPPLVSPPQPAPPPQPIQQPQYMTSPQPQQYSPRSYDYQNYHPPPRSEEHHLTQSRTFKVLESLMSSEEPAAGVQGLPPQRTLSQERWKAEQEAKRGGPRVKVFMPQQYNSPLGIYSAKNVVETFQAQAETVMDAMERHSSEQYPISEVQRAVMDN